MAHRRGRHVFGWGLAAAVFAPVLLILAFLPPKPGNGDAAATG